ncbi:MAG: cell wall metabolism sensor histidine kinase WalK [Clostridia bacterium]|nr:cell wall metabolism sensor histidine kinase WalK [Clostridia bacterium]
MFKTIFSKLVVIFICILIVSFSIAGIVLYYFLDNYGSSEKVKSLEQSAEKISNFFSHVENQRDPMAVVAFEWLLKSYSESTGSIVWVVDKDGQIRYSKPEITEMNEKIQNRLKYDTGYPALPDERQYKKVMTGESQFVREKGDFYGLFKDTGWSWITIEKPLKDNKEQIIGAVYLHAPISEINKTRTSVFGFFMVSVAVSILISIVLVYIFSLRISKPLKEINNAAKVIAGGEFRKRLSINSSDEIGELANSFNQMVVALQNLEEMRRGFIANVSHELRTPMTSIRGFIEGILDETIPPERQRDYLVIVRDETNRLNRLVNDLLDLARMEAGEVGLNYKNFNINELIRRCIIKLESFITSKNIQVEASFEEEDMFVSADTDAVERVIINLVHNAIKFTPESGKITVSTSAQKDKIIVTVEDNGIGIDKDEISLIWDRFYKTDKSRSKDKSGAGLGLAIVKNIINEHQQEIWVESELGKGTRFYFTLSRSDL